jgi:hypothetical protein
MRRKRVSDMNREDIVRISVFATSMVIGLLQYIVWLRKRPFNYRMVTLASALGATLIIIFAMVGKEAPLTPERLVFAVFYWLVSVGSTYFIMRTLARRRQATPQ